MHIQITYEGYAQRYHFSEPLPFFALKLCRPSPALVLTSLFIIYHSSKPTNCSMPLHSTQSALLAVFGHKKRGGGAHKYILGAHR